MENIITPADRLAFDTLTPPVRSLIYYALIGLKNSAASNVLSLKEQEKLNPVLADYYGKIINHTESLEMLLMTYSDNQPPHLFDKI